MLEVLGNCLGFISKIGYFGLLLSYQIGHGIVYFLNNLLNILVTSSVNIAGLFQVLFEEFPIFLYDVIDSINTLLHGLAVLSQSFWNGIAYMSSCLKTTVSSTFDMVENIFSVLRQSCFSVFYLIGAVLLYFKEICLLTGSGVWFLLTFLPSHLYYIWEWTCENSKNIPGLLYDCFKDTLAYTIQFIETRLSSHTFVGFITICTLIYLCAAKHKFIVHFLLHKLPTLCLKVVLNLTDKVTHFIGWIINRFRRRTKMKKESACSNERDFLNEDKFCIICQEHDKCVVILPCKHLCLCHFCSASLEYYNNSCPICRCQVTDTMKVFV